MRLKTVAACAITLILATACARTPVSRAQAQRGDDIAPQTVDDNSPVALAVVPARVRPGGRLEVHLTVGPGGVHPSTASHVWLDKNVNGTWEAAWVLTRDDSASIDTVRKGLLLTDDGIGVPGVMAFTLDPAPPPGEYRLRLGVVNGNERTEGPGQPPRPTYWSAAMIEVLPSA